MMIPPLQKTVVERKQWLNEERFSHLVAKAQLIPGAFSFNLSAIIGRELAGAKGACSAILGTGLPILLLFSLLVAVFSPMRHWSLFESALAGMRPAIIGLLGATAFRMGRQSLTSLAQWLYPISIALIIGFGHLAPTYVIVLIFASGFIYGKYIKPQL